MNKEDKKIKLIESIEVMVGDVVDCMKYVGKSEFRPANPIIVDWERTITFWSCNNGAFDLLVTCPSIKQEFHTCYSFFYLAEVNEFYMGQLLADEYENTPVAIERYNIENLEKAEFVLNTLKAYFMNSYPEYW